MVLIKLIPTIVMLHTWAFHWGHTNPFQSIPLVHRSAPALSTLSHASNLDWWSVSHMIVCTFQCRSPQSSHPHLLPQSPKDCSIHLCLFFCLAYRVMILLCWMLSFKPTFSLSFFTLIKKLFSSSSLSTIRVVSSAYLRLLIFLPQSWFQLVLLLSQRFSWCTRHIS